MTVTLLTDYGYHDEFVGICHGVLRRICPGLEIVDITHGIPRHAVRRGALVLRDALPYMPVGVHMAVVDPEVGTARRAVALRCADGRLLVGPDNGLLSPAWENCGGVREAVEISRSPHRLEPVAATFHGRDIFAPVAAHLAAGERLAGAGETVDAAGLVGLELPAPRIEEGVMVAHVLAVDGFGNVALNLRGADLAATGLSSGGAIAVEVGPERYWATLGRTFADVRPGELLLYEDAHGALAIAMNRGDAAGALGLGADDEVRLSES